MPSDDLHEMLEAVLKLDGGKGSQEIVTEFNNMHQSTRESTDSFFKDFPENSRML